MSSTRWVGLLQLILLCWVTGAHSANPCVTASGGIGGTGAPAGIASADDDAGQDDGIGGTGVRADEGGIGGTGIVGVITGFGSICVGGVEIHYGPKTPISSDGRSLVAADLKIGHVVQVHARGLGDSVRATSIEMITAVSGPVSRIDATARRLEVLGQSVRVTPESLVQAQQAKQAGHPVMVSGMRTAKGDIVATRVDAAPDLHEFGVIGPVSSVTRDSARIGDLQIKLDREQAGRVSKGQVLEICGVPENGGLRALTIEEKGPRAFKGRVERVVLEGFVTDLKSDHVRVDDTQFRLNPETRSAIEKSGALRVDERVVVSMRMENGKYVAEVVRRVREHGEHRGSRSAGERDGDDADSQSGGSSSGKGGESDAPDLSGSRDKSEDSRHGSSGGSKDSIGDKRKPDSAERDRSSSGGQRSTRDSSSRPPKPERASGSSSQRGKRVDRVK